MLLHILSVLVTISVGVYATQFRCEWSSTGGFNTVVVDQPDPPYPDDIQACSQDNPAPNQQQQLSLTSEQQQFVVTLHNKLRSEVKPAATNMKYMQWSDTLGKVASDWARCDSNYYIHHKKVDPSFKYGENLFTASQGFPFSPKQLDTWALESAIRAWYDEEQWYIYSQNECWTGKVCGHYTQVVWAESDEVGCGFALDCSAGLMPYNYYLVCNYNPPGNYIGQKPYTSS